MKSSIIPIDDYYGMEMLSGIMDRKKDLIPMYNITYHMYGMSPSYYYPEF
jgi:hypothetical protein